MATATVRAGDLAAAVLNRAATTAEKTELLGAFAMLSPPGATNEQIAEVMIGEVRRLLVDQVKAKRRHDAAAAAVAAADTDYAPSP